jgi:hypothetical protein
MKFLIHKWWARWGLLVMTTATCVSCASTKPRAAIEVKVPVPVACEIEQVPASKRITAPKGSGIFDLAKLTAADRRRLMAENERLRAANNNPCPVIQGASK